MHLSIKYCMGRGTAERESFTPHGLLPPDWSMSLSMSIVDLYSA